MQPLYRTSSYSNARTAWGMVIALACAVVVGEPALANPARAPRQVATTVTNLEAGVASYYASKFHGRLTANGDRYHANAYTCAHKSLPFGTVVVVEAPATGKSVMCRVNDRGPFKRGRIVDLSHRAATELGLLKHGLARVQLRRASPAERAKFIKRASSTR